MANYGSVKGIDQRPYDREKFNKEIDRIFGKGGNENENDSKGQDIEASKGRGKHKPDGGST